MRPVVSLISAPTYYHAKYLDKWFSSRIELQNPHSILNSTTLVQEITDMIPALISSLVSFDVVSLIPKISKQVTSLNFTCSLKRYVISRIYLRSADPPTLVSSGKNSTPSPRTLGYQQGSSSGPYLRDFHAQI